MADALVERVIALIDGQVAARRPRLRWMWGEALFCHALLELDAALGEARYLPFVAACGRRWLALDPRVAESDTAAPGLVTYGLQKLLPGQGYEGLTARVLEYLRDPPPAVGEVPNHMGRSFLARFYPRSAWVDSLMMVGVLQARHAAERAEREGLDRAARQPRLFAELLMDPGRGLWYHAYWTGLRSHYPRRPIFWARGNGWALYSIVAILELLPPGHPERAGLVGLLGRSSAALLPLQREDGFWDSLLEKPGRCYPEASATALIAAAWIRAAAAGWLSPEYGTAGARAFRALVASLQTRRGGLSLPGVSGPTIPLPLFPRAGYRLVPRFRDLPYGLAALGFAAIAWMRAGGAVDGKAGPGDTGSHDPA